ncbi:hypothetical protein AAHA92_05921 [Salvia divinorum]|uniref:Uncharacterized protein n=1 Tax=Salvia divinorum TaxID=28513 RepID=A0ABD1I3Z5_SALDI
MKSAISLLLLSLLIIHQAQVDKEKAATKVKSSSTAEQLPEASHETYPGILDIAGMDYSQARRKPPIHN